MGRSPGSPEERIGRLIGFILPLMTRRELLKAAGCLGLTLSVPGLAVPSAGSRAIKLGVITDLHFGFAPDAMARFDEFLEAIEREKPDTVLQLGDFCHPEEAAKPLISRWNSIKAPRINVLGNHDMDKGSKQQIMDVWQMPSRFGVYDLDWLKLAVLDLNSLERQGKMLPYDKGNYFQAGQRLNLMDQEQKEWLAEILEESDKPVLILSHQPLGFAEKGGPIPPEQQEVFDILVQSRARNPRGAAAFCLSGHLHVDRAAIQQGIPCLSVNSASYHWCEGMNPYRDSLFAFIEIHPKGAVKVRGRQSQFINDPPRSPLAGFGPNITDRRMTLWKSSGIILGE